MRQLPILWAAFCAAALLCDHCVRGAEIILDDFVDPAMVVSPADPPGTQNEFLETVGVGALDAVRGMRIFYLGGSPIGTADANITTPSVLTSAISSVGGDTLVTPQVNYSFDATDLTDGGVNNALFFDFLQLTSEMRPPVFKARLNEFFDFNFSLELNPEPFTIAIPFTRFQPRGGSAVLDPTDISFASFSIWASDITGGGPDPLNFHVELDRIRVGRIPEPNSSSILLCSLLFGVSCRVTRFHSKEALRWCSRDD